MSELSKNENVIYQLETLASYEKSDLDYPVFEVAYEVGGCDSFAEVSCIDVASDAVNLIGNLESQLTAAQARIKELERLNLSFAMAEHERNCKLVGAPRPPESE